MLPVSDEAYLGEEGVAGHHHQQAGQAEHAHRHRQPGEGGAEVDGAGGQDLRGGRLCSITALLLVSTWSTLPAMRMVLLPSLSANAPARNRPSTAVSLRILTVMLL